MKPLILLTALTAIAFGQSAPVLDTNLAAFGISYKPGDSTPVAGTGLYAKLATGGIYAFTAVDALPSSFQPFTVTTQFSVGVAQKIFTLKGVTFFIPTSAGISYGATNTGWAWTTGGLACISKSSWRLLPNVRVVKSSVNNRSDYQVIGGVLIGVGW